MLSQFSLEALHIDKNQLEDMVRHMATPSQELGDKRSNPDEKDKDRTKPVASPSTNDTSVSSARSKHSISNYFFHTARTNGKKNCCVKCLTCHSCRKDDEEKEFEKVAAAVHQKKGMMTVLTLPDYINQLAVLTRAARDTFNYLNEIKSCLEYTTDPAAEAQGLSRIGGFMWMLTYSVQHLVNPMGKTVNLAEKLIKTQELFQQAASLAHKLACTVVNFYAVLQHYRDCAAWIVKKSEDVFELDESPFTVRPENIRRKSSRHIKRRIGHSIAEEHEADGLFHVQWSPLTVLTATLSSEDSKPEPLVSLDIITKIQIIETFMKEAVNLISNATSTLALGSEPICGSAVTYSSDIVGLKSDLTTVLFPIIQFLSQGVKDSPPSPTEKDISLIKRNLDEFWFTVDGIENVGYEVKNLIQESRDIVRSCYVYAIQFYHWKLLDYDTFQPISYLKGKRPTRTSIFFAKIMGSRRISDNILFLSLADFTSSIYQYVSQENPITANGITLSLKAFEEDESNVESWGLVPGSFDHLQKDKGGSQEERKKS